MVTTLLSGAALTAAKREFESDWPSYLTLHVSAALAREAGALAERYALRGFDAVHLASFAELRRISAVEARFSSFDDRVNKAAANIQRRSRR